MGIATGTYPRAVMSVVSILVKGDFIAQLINYGLPVRIVRTSAPELSKIVFSRKELNWAALSELKSIPIYMTRLTVIDSKPNGTVAPYS